MSERKNLQEYYPADFDPSKASRSRSATKPVCVVNFVCPFRSMRCLTCAPYITKGTKFYNTPKTISEETYLGCQIVRLHAKRPHCRGDITIETDPMNMDYRIESGAKRGYEAWRDGERSADTVEQRLERLEREMEVKGYYRNALE